MINIGKKCFCMLSDSEPVVWGILLVLGGLQLSFQLEGSFVIMNACGMGVFDMESYHSPSL